MVVLVLLLLLLLLLRWLGWRVLSAVVVQWVLLLCKVLVQ